MRVIDPGTMKIILHDYCGHPFQIQLSRWLAGRGHMVLHLYSTSFPSPRGPLEQRLDDPACFVVKGIRSNSRSAKYNYAKRWYQERQYARLLINEITKFAPDILISSNTPIDILNVVGLHCMNVGVPWVLWLQDIYSLAIETFITRKLPIVGPLIAQYYRRKERNIFEMSTRIVAISSDFNEIIRKIGGLREKVEIIENWAPLSEISPQSKINQWSARHGLTDKFCFIYSGTLGLKHNPELLVVLATHFRGCEHVRIVVICEGPGAKYLGNQIRTRDLDNMILMPWQPFGDLSSVLATADVLVTILEADAGVLSVPSKVLSNLCANRPQLLAVPGTNLAARIVDRERAGLVVAPDDLEAWLSAADRLFHDPALRSELAGNGRRYAKTAFDIDRITDAFEDVLRAAAANT